MNAIRPWLYIGNYQDSLDAPALRAAGVEAVLQLALAVQHPDLDTFHVPVYDGEPLPHDALKQGVAIIEAQHDRPLLVACLAGISRATTFCIAALHTVEGMDLLEAYREIKAVRPIVQPHPALWESLCAYYDVDIPYQRLLER